MRTVKTVLRMKEGEIKENDGRGEFKLWCILRIFVNVPPVQNNMII
jgi:hypothetical protein